MWRRLSQKVASFFASWEALPAQLLACWMALGWSKTSWLGAERPPAVSWKPFEKLNDREQEAAYCLGYTEALWDATCLRALKSLRSKEFKGDVADLVLCRRLDNTCFNG